MATVQDPALAELVEELVHAFGKWGEGAAQRIIERFLNEQASAGNIELIDRGRSCHHWLRVLAQALVQAQARGDTTAFEAEVGNFRVQHATDQLLQNAADELRDHLRSNPPLNSTEREPPPAGTGPISGTRRSAEWVSPTLSPRLADALGNAEEALEVFDWKDALDSLAEALEENPAYPRTLALLGTLLERAPGLANEIRNVLEPFEQQLTPQGRDVLDRARMLIMSSMGSSTAPSANGAALLTSASALGSMGSPPNDDAAADPYRGQTAYFEQEWNAAMELLRDGEISEFIRRLRLIPPADRHYEIAQSYLQVYDPDDPEMQRVSVELARLIVYRISTLVDVGDRLSLEEVRGNMAQARKLIDEYNRAHPERPIPHPAKVDEFEGIAAKGLQGWAAKDRAEWALKAGRAAEARSAYQEFAQLAPIKAELPDSLTLLSKIDRLAVALEIAQRFQALGAGLEPVGVDTDFGGLNSAAQALVECVEAARLQAEIDAAKPADQLRVTGQHAATLEANRDLLRVGVPLLDLKAKAAALVRVSPDPATVGRDYEPFLSAVDALHQSVGQHAASSDPALLQLCAGATDKARNLLEAEADTLMSTAACDELTDGDFAVLLDLAYTLLQRVTLFETGGQRPVRSPNPGQARSASTRHLARRLNQMRRGRRSRWLTRRVVQFVAATLAVVVALAALWVVWTYLQTGGGVAQTAGSVMPRVFNERLFGSPAPVAAPTPLAIPTEGPSDRVDDCVYEAGFNICDDPGGMAFRTRWQKDKWFLGRPLTPVDRSMEDANRPVQYFEGGRLEFDPEDREQSVKLGLLGEELLKLPQYAATVAEYGRPVPRDARRGEYVPGPNLHVAPEFVDLYREFSGAQLFGDPLLEAYVLPNGGTKVQWFQRARLEAEPTGRWSKPQVRLGALGREYVMKVLNLEPRPY